MTLGKEVEVLRGPGRRNPSKPRVDRRKGGAERSGERNRGPTHRNWIGGGVSQGERANDREALATKGRRRRSGGRAAKAEGLTWGGLTLAPERATPLRRSEKSAEAIVGPDRKGREGPNGRESALTASLEGARRQKTKQLELPLGKQG